MHFTQVTSVVHTSFKARDSSPNISWVVGCLAVLCEMSVGAHRQNPAFFSNSLEIHACCEMIPILPWLSGTSPHRLPHRISLASLISDRDVVFYARHTRCLWLEIKSFVLSVVRDIFRTEMLTKAHIKETHNSIAAFLFIS